MHDISDILYPQHSWNKSDISIYTDINHAKLQSKISNFVFQNTLKGQNEDKENSPHAKKMRKLQRKNPV